MQKMNKWGLYLNSGPAEREFDLLLQPNYWAKLSNQRAMKSWNQFFSSLMSTPSQLPFQCPRALKQTLRKNDRFHSPGTIWPILTVLPFNPGTQQTCWNSLNSGNGKVMQLNKKNKCLQTWNSFSSRGALYPQGFPCLLVSALLWPGLACVDSLILVWCGDLLCWCGSSLSNPSGCSCGLAGSCGPSQSCRWRWACQRTWGCPGAACTWRSLWMAVRWSPWGPLVRRHGSVMGLWSERRSVSGVCSGSGSWGSALWPILGGSRLLVPLFGAVDGGRWTCARPKHPPSQPWWKRGHQSRRTSRTSSCSSLSRFLKDPPRWLICTRWSQWCCSGLKVGCHTVGEKNEIRGKRSKRRTKQWHKISFRMIWWSFFSDSLTLTPLIIPNMKHWFIHSTQCTNPVLPPNLCPKGNRASSGLDVDYIVDK